ncbi:hypothetical protein [Sulfoacidibacillus thermotolerans]|uniref:Uncharacterized protein n=1 Tax=Sulfoacidibacillus thermotolerans TaxID=1765684 RepID=A0A2U3D600_SULT2|nr:hypothetical protein [Sulfoacidibacillus thermotolerans]PWI56707.1 hypothetical protein BM613_12340 [Sulfoacidibacillus thermotolerans]
MNRPTALIRRLLITEALQEFMTREVVRIKEEMRAEGIKILDRKDNPQDVWVQYKFGNEFEEAIFMRRMLDAESRNRAKRTGMIT